MEPALGHEPHRRQSGLLQLLLDDAARLLRLHSRGRVDEDRVAVARHREPVLAQLVGERLGIGPREAEPVEEAACAFLVRQLDPNAPVVLGHQAGAPAVISERV